MTIALAIAFHAVGGPFIVGEAIYGAWLVAAILILPLFVLLPIAVALAIAAPGARKEAEYRRAVCADSPSRPVVECRLSATNAIVIEIDKERPERGLYRGATLTSDAGCLIITTGVAGRSFGIRSDFDCTLVQEWPRRAAEIERYITALHVVP
jgi:hypothetical protein